LPNEIIVFIFFYFGVSIALIVLSLLFKQIIKKLWFLKLPLIFGGIIFFPFGLIMLGYCLRMWDENRSERKYYAGDEGMSEDSEAYTIDSNIKW